VRNHESLFTIFVALRSVIVKVPWRRETDNGFSQTNRVMVEKAWNSGHVGRDHPTNARIRRRTRRGSLFSHTNAMGVQNCCQNIPDNRTTLGIRQQADSRTEETQPPARRGQPRQPCERKAGRLVVIFTQIAYLSHMIQNARANDMGRHAPGIEPERLGADRRHR
jgi:hypothetical protein